ncbi:hypothetical protein F5Y01DRAFT_162687 [Xylaria sp. FL0043]|nr:hypothetical protein F5Y01DRAFT_162687 [Xylaria sp. FL0043]
MGQDRRQSRHRRCPRSHSTMCIVYPLPAPATCLILGMMVTVTLYMYNLFVFSPKKGMLSKIETALSSHQSSLASERLCFSVQSTSFLDDRLVLPEPQPAASGSPSHTLLGEDRQVPSIQGKMLGLPKLIHHNTTFFPLFRIFCLGLIHVTAPFHAWYPNMNTLGSP